MKYQDFIAIYPWVDLFLELFKGIMPTLAALLAIFLNNKISNKRENKKMIIDMKTKSILSLQNNAIDISNRIYITGKEFIMYIENLGAEDEGIYFNRFFEANNELLLLARKMLISTTMEVAKTDIEGVDFNDCFKEISKYCEGFADIMEYHDKKASVTLKLERDKLLYDIQKKMIEKSGEVEVIFLDYVENLAKIEKNLHT